MNLYMYANGPVVLFLIFIVTTNGCGINYTQPGDIILRGLIPLHTYNETDQDCGELRSIDSFKRVEAMVYAIQKINEDPTLLPNITLGFDIHDTCSSNSRTLLECLNFIPTSEDTCRPSASACSGKPDRNAPVVGVVGAQRSASSVQATSLLGQYHIPMVSYLSTSDELSNNLRYPYFLRTVGPNYFQARTIIDILFRFQWTYVAFINSDDTYGRSAKTRFDELASQEGICVGYSKAIAQSSSDKEYDGIVQELVNFQNGSHASVVILFAHLENAQMMFSATTRMGATRRFIWIGGDAWGNYGEDAINEGDEEAALGAFTIVPESKSLPNFTKYFRSLTPGKSNNPWLHKFLPHLPRCPAEDPSNSNSTDTQSSHETLVMDSVYAFAHALDNMRQEMCPPASTGLCTEMQLIDGELLLTYLLRTSFTSLANGDISFMSNGDISGRYSIRYFNLTDNAYKFVQVGRWDKDVTLAENITWYTSNEIVSGAPVSVCSKPCKKGEIKVSFENPCCWSCIECDEHEYIVDNSQCQSCIDRQRNMFGWPDENRTSCVPIAPSYNNWKVPFVILASLGLLCTCIIAGLYIYNRDNRLIKASSREISYIMFVGIFLAYFSALLYVVHPTTEVCYLLRLCSPVATSFIYVSLCAKTTRLYRIFRAKIKSVRRPKFIRPMSQIVLILALTGIPLMWTIIWMTIDVPEVTGAMPRENRKYLEITCSHSDDWTYGLMVWNMFVVFVCTILAALTRKLPENYNESKFITFCAFCSLVVFLAFSSTFLAISHENAYSIAGYSSLGLIVNATVVLISLFLVKLYAAYFVHIDKWNVRRGSSVSSFLSSSRKTTDLGVGNSRNSSDGDAIESPNGDGTESPNGDVIESPNGNIIESPNGDGTQCPDGYPEKSINAGESSDGENTESPNNNSVEVLSCDATESQDVDANKLPDGDAAESGDVGAAKLLDDNSLELPEGDAIKLPDGDVAEFSDVNTTEVSGNKGVSSNSESILFV